jgi:hypothetical protein
MPATQLRLCKYYSSVEILLLLKAKARSATMNGMILKQQQLQDLEQQVRPMFKKWL